ncbi:uncharacterized protein K02A2.6-like [Frankliniella occidentalis]|uniref:RNA-directed DNA polymerase n=1 Tax=Frankliniella occidentalis TaxID=133901 RepID=A0A9C6XCY1_FRAOC|nr:uncharacterized protein K02A2.6-like [Frankliniella occidentalis]
MINFYGKFLPKASTVFKPLYDLLAKDAVWDWNERCEEAFELSKEMLLKSKALAVYDPSKELILISDASPVGVGAVLAIREGNEEKPVEFMSKMLTITQQRYSQLEREALGIIIALQKFHKYLWGRKFKIVTDNMPLKSMFSPTKTTPKVSAQRLQRWSVILGNYDYDLEYRKSSQMGAADMLSRLPVKEYAFDETCNFVVDLPDLPVSCETVILETSADPQLSAMKSYIQKGWPATCPAADLKTYFDVRYALSLENNCILLGDRVVVPPTLHKKILQNLHDGHPGMVRMKLRARSIMWWPTITKDIEDFVARCDPCSKSNFKAVSTEHVPWTPTTQPWERIHIDFYFLNQVTYLLCVDSHSKWVEVWSMSKTNASAVIDKLSLCFSTWGLPVEIMSDNGPPFNSVEFIDFCTKNLIVVSKSAPYHPEGNGQAERYVQTVKIGLKKALTKDDNNPVSLKLSNYLLALRTTPSTVTKKCPCDLMLAYEPKTLVNAIKPNLRTYVPSKRQFQINDLVKVKLSAKHEVFDAKILKIAGPTLLHVEKCDDHKVVQVSTNQIQPKPTQPEQPEVEATPSVSFPERDFHPKPVLSRVTPKPVVTPARHQPVTPATPRPMMSPVSTPVRSPNVVNDSQVSNPNGVRGTPMVTTPLPQRELRSRATLQKPERFRSNDFVSY